MAVSYLGAKENDKPITYSQPPVAIPSPSVVSAPFPAQLLLYLSSMKTHNGFTLIELMVVVAITAILVVVAAPNMADMLAANRVQAEQREFAGALSATRAEAAARGRTATLCRSSDGSSCGGSWSDGWIIFQDNNANGSRENDETLIRVGNSGSATVAVFDDAGAAVNAIRFDRQGFSNTRLTVRLCGEQPRHARAVLLEPTGRVALSQADASTGIHNDVENDPLVCS